MGPAFPLGYSQVPASRHNRVKHPALKLERNTRPLPLPRLTIARCPAFWRDTVPIGVETGIDRDGKARSGIVTDISRDAKKKRRRHVVQWFTSRNRCFSPAKMRLGSQIETKRFNMPAMQKAQEDN